MWHWRRYALYRVPVLVIIFNCRLRCLCRLFDSVLRYFSGFVCSILSIFTVRIQCKRFSDFCYPVSLARLILLASFLLLKRNFSLRWIGISVKMYLILLFSSLSSTGPPVPLARDDRIPPCLTPPYKIRISWALSQRSWFWMSRLCYPSVPVFCECCRLSGSGFLVGSANLTLWLCLPRQYQSACSLARDDRIPPCLAPVQDTEILGVEPEKPVLCK